MHNPAARVLIVEDHGFQRWALEQALRRIGIETVVTAEDGQAALEEIASASAPFDIVVSDLDMPGMDGMEFIRHLAAADAHVALIVLSAQPPALLSSVEAIAQAYRVRFLGALQKPLDAAELRRMLLRHSEASVQDDHSDPAPLLGVNLAAAIENGDVFASFQPKISLDDKRVVGAEALARWQHPQHGFIAPRVFIEMAESAGLHPQLARHILRQSARACAAWHAHGLHATVAVNLSISALNEAGLPEAFEAIVESEGITARDVILELTESVAASDSGAVLENLSRFRLRGFGLSIDDYGTGYSSMQRLTRVPFTELKIDQSFVQRAVRQPASRAIVESSLEMARKLGIVAVAEGVETQEQYLLLKDLGCPLAQGHLFRRAVSTKEFIDYARAAGLVSRVRH